jgi:hypothetical protein
MKKRDVTAYAVFDRTCKNIVASLLFAIALRREARASKDATKSVGILFTQLS